MTHLFQSHTVLDEQSYPRVEIPDVLLEHEILLRLAGYFRFVVALGLLGWFGLSNNCKSKGELGKPTSCQIILDLQILLLGGH